MNPKIIIRSSQLSDIPEMVCLSYQKRIAYEKAQPQFWRHAKNAEESQERWFEFLLSQKNFLMLTAVDNEKVLGFVIGELKEAPEVYDPMGLTLVIDDFCVQESAFWETVGEALIIEIKQQAKNLGAAQIIIVSGFHDENKKRFLKNSGLHCVSEWYVSGI